MKIHVWSHLSLREYLNTFQGFPDAVTYTPLEPTDIEKANTLLAGVESVRYQVANVKFWSRTCQPHLQRCQDTTHVL